MVNDAPFGYVYLSRKVYPIRYDSSESGDIGHRVGLEPTTLKVIEPSALPSELPMPIQTNTN